MKFSICLPCTSPADEFIEWVKAVESHGFENLWLADMGLQMHDVFVYLALAALNTSRVRLGACVHHPYVRHTAVSLNGMVTVDQMSQGRGLFGVGIGSPTVVNTLGFGTARVATMRELLSVVRRLMKGETVSTDVSPLQLNEAKLWEMPARALPIYLAATGPKMLGLAGECADGVFAHVGVSRETIEFALEACRAGGRARSPALEALDFTPFLHTSIAADRKQAWADCRGAALRVGKRAPQYIKLIGGSDEDVVRWKTSPERAGELAPETVIDNLSLSGTAADCIRKIETMAACGVGHVTAYPVAQDKRRVIDALGLEVIPHFR